MSACLLSSSNMVTFIAAHLLSVSFCNKKNKKKGKTGVTVTCYGFKSMLCRCLRLPFVRVVFSVGIAECPPV